MNITTPIARKNHICYDCHKCIEVGEKYIRRVYFPGEYDFDELCEIKLHRFCDEHHTKYRQASRLCWDEGSEWSEVLDAMWQEWGVYTFLEKWRERNWAARQLARDLALLTDSQVSRFQKILDKPEPTFEFDAEELEDGL